MPKPNVIWIYSDELRADGLGCYGNPYAEMQTPNLDAIAESGAIFQNCYCNSPVCVSSRTSVLTGLYAEDTGVYHNEGFWSNYRMDEPLPVTIPEVFAQHGYTTANFGKIHIPHQFEPWMHDEPGRIGSGFAPDRERAFDHIRVPGTRLSLGAKYPGDVAYPPEENTDNALRWLAEVDGPYFARLSYLQPHAPVFAPPPYDTLYLDGDFPRRFEENVQASLYARRFAEVTRGPGVPEEAMFLAQVYYYGLVAWLDGQVGRILDFLRSRGELDNTILMFGADHGHNLGEDGGTRQKHLYAPRAHQVPLLISWPGTLPAGQGRDDICECLDCGRTLFSLAGIEAPDQFKGRDLFSEPAPEAVYATIGYGFADSRTFPNLGFGTYVDDQGWPRRSCVRTEQYRLDKNVRLNGKPAVGDQQDLFLADARVDPEEKANLGADPDYVDVVERLSGMIDEHVADCVEVPHEYVEGRKRF